MSSSDKLSEDAILRIGKVIAVEGRAVKVKVDKTKNSSHLLYKGEILRNVSVGSYVKLAKGFIRIVGKVEGEFITVDRQFDKMHYGSDRNKIHRILNLSLIGFFKGVKFERGIKELPLIDNECFLLQKCEFDEVHHFVTSNDEPLPIGTLTLEKGQLVHIGVNGLFASHIGIFGNTGSGKSYTLAKLYHELFAKYGNKSGFKAKAEFFLIDFNGEYTSPAGDPDHIITDASHKTAYRLSTRTTGGDRYPVLPETVNDPDFWIIFLEATAKTQAPFLRRAVTRPYLRKQMQDSETFKRFIGELIAAAVAKNDRNLEKGVVLDFLRELKGCLGGNESVGALYEKLEAHLQWHSTAGKFYYEENGNKHFSDSPGWRESILAPKINALAIDLSEVSVIGGVRIRIILQYFDDIVGGFANRDHLSPLIKRLDKRLDDLEKVIEVHEGETPPERKNLTVVSLLDVNIHMRKILPFLLCKMLYTEKKEKNDPSKYLNLIVDEAHNILSDTSDRESEQWKDYRLETFEEIIKEGRKFGVFLTIASQRPSDISPTIISQLHNYVLHRLINSEDIRAVEKTISYLDRVSFESLPILPTGTCIVAGLLVNLPVVVDIGRIDPAIHEPKSKTITLTDKWG